MIDKSTHFKQVCQLLLFLIVVHSVHIITSAKVEVKKEKKTRTKQLLISLANACLTNEGKHRFSLKGRSGQIFPDWEEIAHCGHMHALYGACGSSVRFFKHPIPLFVSCDPNKDLFHRFCFKRSDTLSFHILITCSFNLKNCRGNKKKKKKNQGRSAREQSWQSM